MLYLECNYSNHDKEPKQPTLKFTPSPCAPHHLHIFVMAASCPTICLCISSQMELGQDYSPVECAALCTQRTFVICNNVKQLQHLLHSIRFYITRLKCTFLLMLSLHASRLKLFLKLTTFGVGAKRDRALYGIAKCFISLSEVHSIRQHSIELVRFDLRLFKQRLQSPFLQKTEVPVHCWCSHFPLYQVTLIKAFGKGLG